MRVACCGLTTLDVIQQVDALPGPDQKVQARSALIEFGGPAANAAFTAVALDCSARLISAVGHGPIGSVVTAQLANAGIELIDMAMPGWEVPISSVAVVGEHRSVISVNAGEAPSMPLPDAALDGCAALLVDGHHLDVCIAAARQARAAGIPVLLDGGSWKPGLENLLPFVDYAIVSADFHGQLTGPVAVSRGSLPVLLGDLEIPVPPVAVVDTVGAGDVLHGAALVALARGASFAEALRAAVPIASRSCSHPGAHAWAHVTTEG
ncbi:MAG: PfkB family carbohydrate kinase [Candidatus Nanopelagicales bacterium]